MRKLLRQLTLVIAVSGSESFAQAPAERAPPNVFAAKKGMALTPFVKVNTTKSPEGVGLVFKPEWTQCSQDLAANLSASGIKVARIVFNPLVIMNPLPALREAAVREVMVCTDRLLDDGVAVIVNAQFWWPNIGPNQFRAIRDPRAQAELHAGLLDLAKVLEQRPQDSVGLEPFNEPPCFIEGKDDDWQSLQSTLIDDLRQVAPTLPLIVTGCVGTLDGMMNLADPLLITDEKIIFTFHFYEPFVFTHQHTWGGMGLDLIEYPPQRSGAPEVIAIAEKKLADLDISMAKRVLIGGDVAKYLSSSYGVSDIDRRFEQAADWARRHRVSSSRIFVGEFGASIGFKPTDGTAEARASEIRWITDVRKAAERQNFAFIYWNFPRATSYSFDPSSRFLKPEYVKALGLNSLPK